MTAPRVVTLCALLGLPLASLAQSCNVGNPRVAPDTRYVVSEPVSGQPVVIDLETGLMWKRCIEGQTGTTCTGSSTPHTWSAALALARASTHAGFDDWRLPNAEELFSLVETGCHSPAINAVVFPNAGGLFPWSSTTRASNATLAWRLSVSDGQLTLLAKNIQAQVRLVRGGAALDRFDSGGLIFRNGFE